MKNIGGRVMKNVSTGKFPAGIITPCEIWDSHIVADICDDGDDINA